MKAHVFLDQRTSFQPSRAAMYPVRYWTKLSSYPSKPEQISAQIAAHLIWEISGDSYLFGAPYI